MKVRSFNLPFSVADTESGPIIKWENFQLKVTFHSYQNLECDLVFEEVTHFELLAEANWMKPIMHVMEQQRSLTPH